jgi:Ca2+/Na+ antiporter
MKLGFSLVATGGRERIASLRRAGGECMPVMGAAIVLFALAAGIEGFISPSAAPYELKAAVAIASTLILFFYIVVLGYRGSKGAVGSEPHRDS